MSDVGGHLRKSARSTTRSALPLLADLPRTDTQVRKVPKAGVARQAALKALARRARFSCSGAANSSQNFAPSSFSCWNFGHFIKRPKEEVSQMISELYAAGDRQQLSCFSNTATHATVSTKDDDYSGNCWCRVSGPISIANRLSEAKNVMTAQARLLTRDRVVPIISANVSWLIRSPQ